MTTLERIIFTGVILTLAGVILFGCYTLIMDEQACRSRGGVYVKGFMTYACVERR